MRVIRFLFAIAAIAMLAPQAHAQQSAVMQHYRAYEAALQQGDIPTAAREAQAALAASEARDGDGGRTAVLSLNLAIVRLMAREYGAARAASERALVLGRAGATGVNEPLAELISARAALALDGESGDGRRAAQTLHGLLTAPSAEMLNDTDVYLAGSQLGAWGFTQENWEMARQGWSIAGARPAGSPLGERYGLGRARVNEAVAIITEQLDRRRRARIGEEEAQEAHALLAQAATVLYPLSRLEAPSRELTLAQQAFAEARVWFGALEAKLAIDEMEIPARPQEAQGDGDGLSEIGPVNLLAKPRCMVRIRAIPELEYVDNDEVAAVAVYLRIGPNGEVLSHQIAARAGSQQFADEVSRVAGQWRAAPAPGSASDCRLEANVLQIVQFRLRRS